MILMVIMLIHAIIAGNGHEFGNMCLKRVRRSRRCSTAPLWKVKALLKVAISRFRLALGAHQRPLAGLVGKSCPYFKLD